MDLNYEPEINEYFFYPYPYRSNIIQYFSNNGTDTAGRTLVEVLDKSFEWMEVCHDYIQWLFPLKEPSQFNPDAPILTYLEIDYFRSPDAVTVAANYISGIEKMLSFLGLETNRYCYLKVRTSEDFENRKYTWAEEFNHNHLRVTRMITSMKLLGFEDYAYALYDYISEHAINKNSMKYWAEAINA